MARWSMASVTMASDSPAKRSSSRDGRRQQPRVGSTIQHRRSTARPFVPNARLTMISTGSGKAGQRRGRTLTGAHAGCRATGVVTQGGRCGDARQQSWPARRDVALASGDSAGNACRSCPGARPRAAVGLDGRKHRRHQPAPVIGQTTAEPTNRPATHDRQAAASQDSR